MASSVFQGGYECKFVDPPKELQSECPICLHVIREPYLVDCCGYRFCRTCIKNIEADNRSCPLCNTKFTAVPDKLLQRTLLDKKVTCAHKEDGCEWTGGLRYLDEHLNVEYSLFQRLVGCPYVQFMCEYCKNTYHRKSIFEHELNCPEKPVWCKYCNKYRGGESDLMYKHWPECPSYPVSCSNGCGKACKRMGVKEHIRQHCPLTVINCEFHDIGCKVAICRRDMAEHMETNAVKHVSLLAMERKNLSAIILTLREEIGERDEVIQKLLQQVQPSSNNSNVILATNCPPTANEQKLKCVFGQCGKVHHLQWNSDHNYALVYYSNPESMQRAIDKYNGPGIRLHQTKLEICRI